MHLGISSTAEANENACCTSYSMHGSTQMQSSDEEESSSQCPSLTIGVLDGTVNPPRQLARHLAPIHIDNHLHTNYLTSRYRDAAQEQEDQGGGSDGLSLESR